MCCVAVFLVCGNNTISISVRRSPKILLLGDHDGLAPPIGWTKHWRTLCREETSIGWGVREWMWTRWHNRNRSSVASLYKFWKLLDFICSLSLYFHPFISTPSSFHIELLKSISCLRNDTLENWRFSWVFFQQSSWVHPWAKYHHFLRWACFGFHNATEVDKDVSNSHRINSARELSGFFWQQWTKDHHPVL